MPATQPNPAPTRRADFILEELEQSIVLGEFKDGERLDEVKLSARYGVSRTPIREAFQNLAATGLLNLIPRRGAFVRYPELVELIEMFEVMAELEAMCGRLAARRLSDEMLANIKAAGTGCEQALERNDRDGYYTHNEQFHQLIYQASRNSFLASEAGRLQKRLRPFRRLQLRVRGRMSQSMEQHRQIISALEAGNSKAASSLLHEHISIQGEKFNDLVASYSQKPAD